MKPLVAIVNCHTLRERQDAIRATWLPSIVEAGFDYRFFLGGAIDRDPAPRDDEVFLNCDDSYRGLAAKTKAICAWALEHGYEHLFKCDDDTYVQGRRLMDSDFAQFGDYVGRKRGPSGGRPAPYCSGFSYWLSTKAMRIIAAADLSSDPAEDRHVGNVLLEAGVQAVGDYRYVVTDSRRNALSHFEGPRRGNTIISACEFEPNKMKSVHQAWLTLRAGEEVPLSKDWPFGKVCVIVKTFMRDGYLLKTVEGIQKTMPAAKIVIVDDGRESSFKISWYATLRRQGHVCQWMKFDSGFGAKANEAVRCCDRPYLLVASDDFNFEDPAAAEGVKKLVVVLDCDLTVAVASGRVNNRPYEANLELVDHECRETAGYREDRAVAGVPYKMTDLTVNYSLIRRSTFQKVKWDDDVKIGGGEHGAFYVDLKRCGLQVAWVPGVNVNELRGSTDWSSVEYGRYRGRAREPGRICLKRRGIDRYHLMGGTTEET